jgi:N-acetylmuramoyl-L-alanine amidase
MIMRTLFIRLPRPLLVLGIGIFFIAILCCLRFVLLEDEGRLVLAPSLFGKSVVIDPGHGGWDPGMNGKAGSREADINLEIALKLAEYCREAGAHVTMTRESDIALGASKKADMDQRVALSEAAVADIFISVHANSFPGQRGAQVFYQKNNKEGKALADMIQQAIRDQLQNTDRVALAHADAYLLRNIEGAAVICETGFLSHSEEEALLQDSSYQWDMAWAIFNGIINYLRMDSEQ